MQDLLLNKTKKDNEANLYFEPVQIKWTGRQNYRPITNYKTDH